MADTFSSISDSLTFIFRNKGPYLFRKIMLSSVRLHVDTFFDFSFDENTFWDDDGAVAGASGRLELRAYSADSGPLPAWLAFNPTVYRFQGTPGSSDTIFSVCHRSHISQLPVVQDAELRAINQTACLFDIIVRASDGMLSATDQFTIEVYNTVPFMRWPFYNGTHNSSQPHAFYLHVNDKIDFHIQQSCFEDSDDRNSLYILTEHNPSWLIFNSKLDQLQGAPKNMYRIWPACNKTYLVNYTHAPTGRVVLQKQCQFDVGIIVTDFFNVTRYNFQIIVYNNYPYINHSLPVTVPAHVSQYFLYYIPSYLFGDIDSAQAKFSYSFSQQNTSALPPWLVYQKKYDKLVGVPRNADLLCGGQPLFEEIWGNNSFAQPQRMIKKFCLVAINLTASDGNDISSQLLVIEIFNMIPYSTRPLYAGAGGQPVDLEIHVGTQFSIWLPTEVFEDQDATDKLTFSLELGSEPGNLPRWLYFNAEVNIMFGIAERSDLIERCQKFQFVPCAYEIGNGSSRWCIDRQRCIYEIRAIAFDQFDVHSRVFNITVVNEQPYNRLPIHRDPEFGDEFLRVNLNLF